MNFKSGKKLLAETNKESQEKKVIIRKKQPMSNWSRWSRRKQEEIRKNTQLQVWMIKVIDFFDFSDPY